MLLPLLFLFLFVCGLLHGSSLQPPTSPESLYQLFANRQEATLSGLLLQAPSISPERTRLLVEVDALLPKRQGLSTPNGEDNFSQKTSLTPYIPVQGRIELTLRGPPSIDLLPGFRLLIRANVSRPRELSTPGGFDYSKYLAAKNIWVTGWISSPAHLITLPDSTDSLLPSPRSRFIAERLRFHINRFLSDNLPLETSSLYKAILTGDRSAISPEIMESFRATGTMHLLAISGLHMGLIALGLGALISRLIKCSTWLLVHTSGNKIAICILIPILCGYAFIAGLQLPVLRALFMTLVFLCAVFLDRQWHVPTNIAIAAFIILLINPSALFSASFQLSFAAVISITAFLPYMRDRLLPDDKNRFPATQILSDKLKTVLLSGFLLSLAALAGTLPLLIFYFNRFSPLSAVATLMIEPLLCLWALPLGLISVPFMFWMPPLANLLLNIGAFGLSGAVFLCTGMAKLPLSSIWLPTPLPLEILFYYTLLFSIPFCKKSKKAILLASASILLLAMTTSLSFILQQKNHSDSVTVLDVGQGNAIVVRLDGKYNILIDGGGYFSTEFNVGEKVIAPYLWGERINRLDGLIITHPDADHYNGLAFIIKRFNPTTIWVNGDTTKNRFYTELLRFAADHGAAIRIPKREEKLFSSRNSQLYNVSDIHLNKTNTNENDRSLTVRLVSHGKAFLFTGDIERYAEEKMTKKQEDLQADVLLLPHHGSNSSTSLPFLTKVSPKYAVISAGRSNKSIFPAPEVIRRCTDAGCTIYNTASNGSIFFTVKENGALSINTAMPRHQ